MSIDKFGESPTFQVAGRDTYPSLIGTVLTLIIVMVVIRFGINKFIIMKDRDDTKYQSVIEDRAIGPDEVLTYDQTHVNAFILFVDQATRPISYQELEGYIVVEHYMQTFDRRDTIPKLEIEILTTSGCTTEYLDEHFFKRSKAWETQYGASLDYMYCIDDPTRIEHVANWRELYSKGLNIRVSRCTGIENGCKSEEEIDRFVDSLNMMVYHNN